MQIDVLDGNFWTRPDFWDSLRWLREDAPLYWDAKNDLWVVSKYEDVSYVSRHPKIFCSGEGTRPNMPTKLSIVDMDEPRHGQLRRLISKGFMPRMVEQWERVFRQLTTDAIDRVAGLGACDFVESISVPMPLELIAEMIGIRKGDRRRFHHWSDTMIYSDGKYDDMEVMIQAAQAFAEYVNYLKDIIEERRKNPREDLVSILVHAKDEGLLGSFEDGVDADRLRAAAVSEEAVTMAQEELQMFLVTLLIAGNETTRNAISGGMSALIENPAERQKLVDNPGLIPKAVEEIVRYVSPVLSFARTATQDTELRGTVIKKGQKVLMLYPSANRDADVFEAPDSFKVDRDPNPHLAFGIGNHFCLGANLARMEIRVVLQEVLQRMPDMEYTEGPPKMMASTLVRSFLSMPVRFTPERPDLMAASS